MSAVIELRRLLNQLSSGVIKDEISSRFNTRYLNNLCTVEDSTDIIEEMVRCLDYIANPNMVEFEVHNAVNAFYFDSVGYRVTMIHPTCYWVTLRIF